MRWGETCPSLSAKAQALLFYLASTQRACSREALTGLLWSDSPEDKARLSLRVALNALRQRLPDYLIATRQTIAFNPERPHVLDTRLFAAALHSELIRCSLHELKEALALYRGDFLQDFHVKGAPLFEEWVVLERERLRLQALNTMQQLTAHYLEAGQYEPGITLARRALTIDPWREETHRQLITLLAQSGQRNEALRQYETCRRILLEELGVMPAPETQALCDQIRAGAGIIQTDSPDPTRSTAPPHNLPAVTTPFVGRETELTRLAALVAGDDCRLITLIGPGGVGKSRLALEFGWRCLNQAVPWVNDGIFFVSLANVESGEFISTALLNALGVAPIRRDPQRQLLHYLRNRQLVLILDNFEQHVASAAWLIDILHAAPQVRLIITSREALQVSEEWLFEVGGLTLPLEAESAETCDAVQLFARRAKRVNLAFSLEDELASVIQICRLVDGLPLAIELAASRVRVLSCAALAQAIRHNLDVLVTTYQDVPLRQRSLRATFEQSWRLLNVHEQQVFGRLAVFCGGFQVEAAEQVAGASAVTLATLMDKSLVRRDVAGRFALHDLLRQYAGEKLRESGAKPRAHAVHLAHFLALAQQADRHLIGPEQARYLTVLEVEHDNLRAALHWAFESEQLERAVELCAALARFWLLHNHLTEGSYWLERAWQSSAPVPASVRAKVLAGAGRLSVAMKECERATTLAHQALVIQRELGDKAGSAASLTTLGLVAAMQGNLEQAGLFYEESLALGREVNDEWGIAAALNNLGVIARKQGHYPQACAWFEESLVIRQKLGDQHGVALSLLNLGNIARHQNDDARAQSCYEQSLGLFREVGDKSGIASSLNNLGTVARVQGNFARALALHTESLVLRQTIDDRMGTASALNQIGYVALAQGAGVRAARAFLDSLRVAQELNDQYGLALNLNGLAASVELLGQPARAAQLQGLAQVFFEIAGRPLEPDVSILMEPYLTAMRLQLGETAFEAALNAGRTLSIEQVVADVESSDRSGWHLAFAHGIMPT
ncbi:Putative HTH-type transcriptional regulator [Thermoflexales bacterium]|nr:Putative HTH-type transcriptional regulator [Thermoflexales bacterium]